MYTECNLMSSDIRPPPASRRSAMPWVWKRVPRSRPLRWGSALPRPVGGRTGTRQLGCTGRCCCRQGGAPPRFDGRIVRVTRPPRPCDATPRMWDIPAVALGADTMRETACVFGQDTSVFGSPSARALSLRRRLQRAEQWPLCDGAGGRDWGDRGRGKIGDGGEGHLADHAL